jgi:hypothetical protein
LLIWSANLAEEIPWYLARLRGGWQWVALAILLLHFVLPFMLLISSDVKRDGPKLAGVAGVLFLMHIVDTFWLIVPAFHDNSGFTIHWQDLATVVGVGGLWFAFYMRMLRSRPLVPAAMPETTGHPAHEGAGHSLGSH